MNFFFRNSSHLCLEKCIITWVFTLQREIIGDANSKTFLKSKNLEMRIWDFDSHVPKFKSYKIRIPISKLKKSP